ncbi:MAG: DUF4252 domain-containing protein [Bacteroidaceae bacterium]
MKTKIYILYILLLYCGIGRLHAQSKLYDQFSNMNNVTTVYLSKSLLNFAPNVEGLNIQKVARELDYIVIISSEDKAAIRKLKSVTSSISKSNDYEELMKVKDGDDRVVFLIKTRNNKVKELIMLSDEIDEYTIIQMVGDINLEDVKNLTNNK